MHLTVLPAPVFIWIGGIIKLFVLTVCKVNKYLDNSDYLSKVRGNNNLKNNFFSKYFKDNYKIFELINLSVGFIKNFYFTKVTKEAVLQCWISNIEFHYQYKIYNNKAAILDIL